MKNNLVDCLQCLFYFIYQYFLVLDLDGWIELKWTLSGCLFQHESEVLGRKRKKCRRWFYAMQKHICCTVCKRDIWNVMGHKKGSSWGGEKDENQGSDSLRFEGQVEGCHSANRRTYNQSKEILRTSENESLMATRTRRVMMSYWKCSWVPEAPQVCWTRVKNNLSCHRSGKFHMTVVELATNNSDWPLLCIF